MSCNRADSRRGERAGRTIARPVGIDLFAGAGGMSLGFEAAGFDVAAAVEINPIHCATHEFDFPRCATICRDVRGLRGVDVRRMAGIGARDVAVAFGGAPRQGFSMIGKWLLDDPRNAPVAHFVRLVSELRPACFVFKNAPGLAVGRRRADPGRDTIAAFKRGGYRVRTPFRNAGAAPPFPSPRRTGVPAHERTCRSSSSSASPAASDAAFLWERRRPRRPARSAPAAVAKIRRRRWPAAGRRAPAAAVGADAGCPRGIRGATSLTR